MDPSQFRTEILRPALKSIDLWSPEAEALVMGTGATESHFRYVKQLNGPALGFFQMEPATHDDIWTHYLGYREVLGDEVLRVCGLSDTPSAERLVWDMRYASIMCRIHYLRAPERLPAAEDIWAQGRYWKYRYNSVHGKGTPAKYVRDNMRVLG